MLDPASDSRFEQWVTDFDPDLARMMFDQLGLEGLERFLGDTAKLLGEPSVMTRLEEDRAQLLQVAAMIENQSDFVPLRQQMLTELKGSLAGDDEAEVRASYVMRWATELVRDYFDQFHPMAAVDWVLEAAIEDVSLIAVLRCTYREARITNPRWLRFIRQQEHLWLMGVPISVPGVGLVVLV